MLIASAVLFTQQNVSVLTLEWSVYKDIACWCLDEGCSWDNSGIIVNLSNDCSQTILLLDCDLLKEDVDFRCDLPKLILNHFKFVLMKSNETFNIHSFCNLLKYVNRLVIFKGKLITLKVYITIPKKN